MLPQQLGTVSTRVDIQYQPDLIYHTSDSSTQLHYIMGVVCLGHHIENNHDMWLLSMSVREHKLHLPTVVGTVYKLHPQTGGVDFTMELFQERHHTKNL